MKTPKKPTIKNDMRTEYKRSDFGVMERGKYVEFAQKALHLGASESDFTMTLTKIQRGHDHIVDARTPLTEKQLKVLHVKSRNVVVR